MISSKTQQSSKYPNNNGVSAKTHSWILLKLNSPSSVTTGSGFFLQQQPLLITNTPLQIKAAKQYQPYANTTQQLQRQSDYVHQNA